MGISILDSFLVKSNFSTERMRSIFSECNTIQKWLDAESALAQAQAETGMIPQEAAETISRNARFDCLDMESIKKSLSNTGHPFIPILRAFTVACGEQGGYVHWGATTQDIMDTGLILQLSESYDTIYASVESVIDKLSEKTREHKNTIMMGRTNGQQALPITLGFKYAIWLSEMQRHRRRLMACRERLLTAQFSGAVGTLASLGPDGISVVAGMCDRLGLHVPVITWNTSRDNLVEWASVLGLITATVAKIGSEVYALQKQELFELEENAFADTVGSSTMPHKKNPFLAMQIASLGKLSRSIVQEAFDTLECEHERDPRTMNLEVDYLGRICNVTHAALEKTWLLLDTLVVHEDNMQQNIKLLQGAVLSESVMMKLGQAIGRHKAHEKVHHLVNCAISSKSPLLQLMCADAEITSHISVDELERCLNPQNYLGLTDYYINQVLENLQ